MSMKTITMRAALRQYEDRDMYDRLSDYCDRMNISLQSVQINGEVIIGFTGSEQQLHELETHLEGVGI